MELKNYVLKLKDELEKTLGCEIEIVEDMMSRVPSTFEYAKNYARDHHVVRVNPSRGGCDYSVFSMLMMTKIQLEKNAAGEYCVLQCISSDEESGKFAEDFAATPQGKTFRARMDAAGYDGFVNNARASIATQACYQVLEMLVNDVTVREYPEAVEDMKAWLLKIGTQGSEVPYSQMLQMFPEFVVYPSRLLNIVYSMNAGERCGKKLVDAFNPTPEEIDKGLDLYNFFRKERDGLRESGKVAGDVVKNIFKYLKLEKYAHTTLREIAPIGAIKDVLPPLSAAEQADLDEFFSNYGDDHATDSAVMSIAMYKVMHDLSSWAMSEVKELALEVAMLGASGIDPNKKYSLKKLPTKKEIWGREILAYYYVSWAIAFPEKLDAIGLPYKRAYETAKNMTDAEFINNLKKFRGGGR